MKDFFSNPAWAAWAQNFIIVVSVVVALLTLQDNQSNLKTMNAVAFAQRYFLEKPALSVVAIRLREMQYYTVQEAKMQIPNYNQEANRAAGWSQLFDKARPLVLEKIKNTPIIITEYDEVVNFFTSLIICVEADVCDKTTSVNLLGNEMLAFYNAVCPFIEDREIAFNHEDESPRFLKFLVTVANYRNTDNYFCRNKLGPYLTRR